MNPDASVAPPRQDPRSLAQATAAAAATALIVLVVAILPEEYGVDPTGIGRALGFAKLGDEAPPIVDITGQGPETVYSFDLAWQVRDEILFQEERFHGAVDTEQRVEIPFAGTNLTQLTARLRWDDDDQVGGQATEPDLFEISIQAPQGRKSQLVSARNAADGKGSIEAFLLWRSVPTPGLNGSAYTVDAREDRSAQGPWTITIRLYDAAGNDAGPDPGDTWNLTVIARTYSITNLGVFGSDLPGDRVAFTLQPGGSIEYKFRMDEGATIAYRWNSTAPLTFDFHGDEPGKEEEPVTHKQGVADRDQGNLTVPFSGRHGWWFFNRGQEPVTVTLETRGDYTIIGVV